LGASALTLSMLWLLTPLLLVVGVLVVVFRLLNLRTPARPPSAASGLPARGEPSSRRGLHVAGIILGVFTLGGTIGIVGLVSLASIISSAMGGGSEPGQFSISLVILMVGAVLAALMIGGGRMALVSTDPEMVRRGSLAQAVPAVLVTGLLVVYVVLQFVLPNVGSGRYYHDYSADYDLSDEIQTHLVERAAARGVTVDWAYIQAGGYESELGFDDSEWYLIDYLCERNGVEPRRQGRMAEPECSLVEIQFRRRGFSYRGWVPIHNRIDNVVDAQRYDEIVQQRVIALWELDDTYWIESGGDAYYLNCRDSAPFLTQ